MYLLINKVQNYDWGMKKEKSLIYEITKEKTHNDKYAELWMGDHKNGMNFIKFNNNKISLKEFLEEKELKYLFKILNVEKCLSLQIHPDKKNAEILHKENPSKYPDSNHKPEMALCLSNFKAFCNFCTLEDFYSKINRYDCLKKWIKKYENYREFFTDVINLEEEKIKNLILNLENDINKLINKNIIDKIILRLIKEYSFDKGILITFSLNYIELKEGEAIVLNPNEPHAYIEGNLLEIMAKSDNVIRLGLTPKFKDSKNLMKIINFEIQKPSFVIPEIEKISEFVQKKVFKTKYKTEFLLENLELVANNYYQKSIKFKLIIQENSILLNLNIESIKVNDLKINFGENYFFRQQTEIEIEIPNNKQNKNLNIYITK